MSCKVTGHYRLEDLDGGGGGELMVSPGQAAANTRRWPDAGLLLGQRRRRRPNSKPTLGQRLITSRDLQLHFFSAIHDGQVTLSMLCKVKGSICSIVK